MILIDLNQILISNLMQQIKSLEGEISTALVRHMTLNSLRAYRVKFSEKYGELVICCDSRKSWRRDEFPHYKANRRENRSASDLDWNLIFEALEEIRDDLDKYFPYTVIKVDLAEADDVIAVLCHKFGSLGIRAGDDENILIISGDKDFVQLQKYANVEQYSPTEKKFVTCPNPARFLAEHIMRGDTGDGIPNFLSDADTFVDKGKRQKPLSRKKLDEWSVMDPKDFCKDNMMERYRENERLINLDNVPDDINQEVVEIYDQGPKGDRSMLFNYFIKNRLKRLMDSIGDF